MSRRFIGRESFGFLPNFNDKPGAVGNYSQPYLPLTSGLLFLSRKIFKDGVNITQKLLGYFAVLFLFNCLVKIKWKTFSKLGNLNSLQFSALVWGGSISGRTDLDNDFFRVNLLYCYSQYRDFFLWNQATGPNGKRHACP